jgi:hypothetical protein
MINSYTNHLPESRFKELAYPGDEKPWATRDSNAVTCTNSGKSGFTNLSYPVKY